MQSDPALLALQLRAAGRSVGRSRPPISCIPHGAPDAGARLAAWTARVSELHRAAPGSAGVRYSRPMPALDDLLTGDWSPQLEAALARATLPGPELARPQRPMRAVAAMHIRLSRGVTFCLAPPPPPNLCTRHTHVPSTTLFRTWSYLTMLGWCARCSTSRCTVTNACWSHCTWPSLCCASCAHTLSLLARLLLSTA